MPKKKGVKQKYQAPVVMDLGKIAKGEGAVCSPGSNPTPLGACRTGGSPIGACVPGSTK